MRRTREEEQKKRDTEEVKSQQEQENLTLRLLIMYRVIYFTDFCREFLYFLH